MLRKGFISILALLVALPVLSQSKVSASVEVKTLQDGKVTTVTKREFCNGNGRLVTVFLSPTHFFMTANLKGEMAMYNPTTKEAFIDRDEGYSTKDNLLYLFLAGRSSDLGLASYGYTLKKSIPEEGGYLKRVYSSTKNGATPNIEVVLKDYLPVYVAYLSVDGTVVSKTYLSGYDMSSRFIFPSRVTAIEYLKNRDSTVIRTLYSNLKIDSDEPEFSFELPADAISVANPFKR